MPHIIVDYSANIEYFDPKQLLLKINNALVETGYCQAIDIKSRARKDDVFVIDWIQSSRLMCMLKCIYCLDVTNNKNRNRSKSI